MAQIRNVSGTAFVVAEFRAEENTQTPPLYQDPVVELFLNESTRYAAGLVAASFPLSRDLVRIRTKYLDDMLDRRIVSEARQVVILGAGLDTRAVRKRARGVQYFEIDDPATLLLKEATYSRERIDADLTLIPGNYVTDGLIDLLDDHGFDFDQPTYFIWEGNTMYLPRANVEQTMADIRDHVPHFHLSFDYMAEAVIAKTTGDAGVTRLVDSFADMGAPWITGIRDVRSLADHLQLTLIDNVTSADLYRTYWPDRDITSPIFAYYSLCTVAS